MSHGVAKGPKTCPEFGRRSETMCPTSFCTRFFTHNRNTSTLGKALCARRLIKDATAKSTLWVREGGQPPEATLPLRERAGFVEVTLSLQRSCGMTSALFSRLSEGTWSVIEDCVEANLRFVLGTLASSEAAQDISFCRFPRPNSLVFLFNHSGSRKSTCDCNV